MPPPVQARLRVHVPPVQGAVPLCALVPVTVRSTVAESPDAVPQVPPIVLMLDEVVNGNVWFTPLTCVMLTSGAVLSIVMLFAPDVPVLPAASV